MRERKVADMIATLADAFVKATVVLLLAAGASLVLTKSTAALRHLVWALAFVGLLALPVASAVMPDWRLAAWPRLDVPVAFGAEGIATGVVEQTPTTLAAVPAAAAPLPAPLSAGTPVRSRLRPDWTALVVPLWFSGMVLVLAVLALGLARIAWLGRRARPMRDEAWVALAADLGRGLGLRRPVRLLQSTGPAMPMTWGVWRPVILLPADARAWPAERRRDVLLHELAHVTRQDFLTQLIARVACAAYWFNPLAWLAAGRLRVDRERACDDQVLRAGAKPSAYAGHLLEIARALRGAPATSLVSVAMARPTQLATRLLDVLDPARRRDVVAPRVAVPAWIAALAVVVPLAAVAPRVAEPALRSSSIDTIPRLPPPGMKGIGRDTLKGCSRETKRRSTSTTAENDNLTIVVTLGGCSIRLAATGEFTFNEDYTDVGAVAAGAYVVVEVDYGGHDRRVTIRPGNERVYKVDGDTRPFDAEARTWLAETLTFLLRRTGYAGEERARWILERRGVQGLLDEIVLLTGDYARRIYLQAGIESGRLDVAAYERLVVEAGRTIGSDYELAELLIAIAKVQPLTERMQAGFVAAAKTVGSDYERRRVLRAALQRPGLSPAVQGAMLDAAADINSDYELASLLIELNDARRIDEAVRPAFFNAANSLQSDYEHRRVLTAVVGRAGGRGGASRAILADVLGSARTIDSDYELAELLTEVGSAYLLDEALRPAFFAAAATIGSDYEHGRALTSVLERDDLPRPVTAAIIESAKSISSDYQLAELLIAVIRRGALDDALRAAVRSTAETLQSRYERERVLEALARRTGRAELE
jgi:beta-lactamase regulating signal transducer with metallopeptidase domain